jgi:hypothetical protein
MMVACTCSMYIYYYFYIQNTKIEQIMWNKNKKSGSRWEDDEDHPDVWKLIDADEGDVFVFAYGVVVCWGLTEEQTQELQTVLRFCELRGYVEPEVLRCLCLCLCLSVSLSHTHTHTHTHTAAMHTCDAKTGPIFTTDILSLE